MQNRLELFRELKESLTPMDFQDTLPYYNIKIRNNGILCPLHNNHYYGKCVIRKDGKTAYCFVCEEKISSVNLVVHFERLSPMETMIFLWENILGRKVPDCETENMIISHKEAKMIGLDHLSGHPREIVNMIHCQEEPSQGCDKLISQRDEKGDCPFVKMSCISLYDFEPLVAAELVSKKLRKR